MMFLSATTRSVLDLSHLQAGSPSLGDEVEFLMEKDPVTELYDLNISLGGYNFFPQAKTVDPENSGTNSELLALHFDSRRFVAFVAPI